MVVTRADLQELILDLGGLPDEVRRQLRPALRKAAQPILADARRRSSWSSRIPGAISVKVSLTARNPGVRLVVDSRKAPHARPYEMGSKRAAFGTLRHPVFADPNKSRDDWTWVNERTRPFLFASADAGREGVMRESAAAVIAAARTAGFR